jgi:hypothetical protein
MTFPLYFIASSRPESAGDDPARLAVRQTGARCANEH